MNQIYTTVQWMGRLVKWMKKEKRDTFKHKELPDDLKTNTWFRRATAADYLRFIHVDTKDKTKIWKVNKKFWY